ncbi:MULTISPECIES: Mu transposase C-terminal domain-containing protein [unclassified Neisseria]|uniref:Mu transposase C-terminal domain-containing protein n=1 Tax=unclassified Neisseria TaxID=2623750 RepID=UPI001072B256|nr:MULTISPECIES: Mu transposase C-terminal domain-containing protein [unclassified Neisseria]MBF0803313.1 transposase [Neisseria sp. 19428wB4_WF04]TFU43985.1 hypothetical protein E4T99_02925 [Neisseria sp. WF04]
MKAHYSISELFKMNLEIFTNKTARTIQNVAIRENWSFVEVSCQGGKNGKRREYTPPPEVLEQIRQRQTEKVLAELPPVPTVAQPSTAVSTEMRYDNTTEAQRTREGARLAVLKAVEKLMEESKVGKDAAITTLLTQARLPQFAHVAKTFALALDERGAGSLKLPSSRTIKRWFAAREQNSLAPKVVQKNMEMPYWLPLFLKCYRQPQKLTVVMAYELFCAVMREEYPDRVAPSIHAVRRAMDKCGAVALQDGRMGKRELKNILPHKTRDFLNLKPADIYTADGHTFDAEVLNPRSGRPFRPEITTVVDIHTRRCVGWSVGLAESRLTVLEALSHACKTAIPAIWYVDWGKGFENVMMTDEATGVLGRLGITMSHSRAYNSQAKGASERSHNIFTKAAKFLPTYVGKDMDAEARKKMFHWSRKEIKLQGKIVNAPVMLWDDFKAYVEAVIDAYNNKPHRSLPKFTDPETGKMRFMTPNEMWALGVAKHGEPLRVTAEDEGWLFRPQEMRSVSRGQVSILNNTYFSGVLEEFHGQRVRVAYDVTDAQWVWVYDDVGRLICKAEWNGNSTDYMPKSFIEQSAENRADQALKRLDLKRENVLAEKGVAGIGQQETMNIGGLNINLEQARQQHEQMLAQRMQQQEPETVQAVQAKADTGWTVPETPAERFELYQRIKDSDSLPERAAVWVRRYPNSAEYKSFMNRQAVS